MDALERVLVRRHRRPRRRRSAAAPYSIVLTPDGRSLLERKAAELRRTTLPERLTWWRQDRADTFARAAFADALVDLHRVESLVAQAEPVSLQAGAADQVSLGDRVKVVVREGTDFIGDVDDVERVEDYL